MSDAPYLPQFPGGPAAEASGTLVGIFLRSVEQHPDSPALDDGTTVLSYQLLRERVESFASKLAARNLGRGDRIGVRVPSGTLDLYIAILSTLFIGAAYVPVDVDDPDERARTVFDEANVAAVISENLQVELRRNGEAASPATLPSPDDDCWIIFTSGSTGKPKGVAVTHRSAAAFVEAEARIFLQEQPLGPEDRVLAGLSVAFDASCEEMWLAWGHSACLVPAPRSLVKSGMDLGPWLQMRRITVVSTVPTLAGLWPVEALDSVRLLIFGGEACPPELAERLNDGEREVWNTYGPTEATVVACAALLTEPPVRIGLPLAGWDLAVVNPETGVPVDDGETGELIISGIGLARYLDPAKDAEKYAPLETLGWERAYRTGDLVVNDPVGLIFTGRADEQIKLGGRRIELGEIDSALQMLDGVRAAAAAVKKTPAGSDLLIGYVVTTDHSEPSSSTLSSWEERLRASLPAALVPRLTAVESLPTKTSGKVDRNALPWPLVSVVSDAESDDVPARFSEVSSAWSSVLGIKPSLDADFFSSGGGSLAAAQLVSLLRRSYPSVTVGDIYSHSRFEALAELCLGSDSTAPPRPKRIVKATRKSTQWWQTLLGIPVHIFGAVRWIVLALLISNVANLLGAPSVVTPWWALALLFFVFVSSWGRMLISALCARLVMAGIKPGVYPRSGAVHMRLWFAEHFADVASAVSVSSAPWVTWYARLLGNRIGSDVDLHSVPPVTGFLTLDRGAAIEPEVDLKGWWIDGDLLRLGEIRVGENATVGARSTLMPGTNIGNGAYVKNGSAVTGKVPVGQVYSGSPAVRTSKKRTGWPSRPEGRKRVPFLLYVVGSILHAGIPYLAAVPPVVLAFAVSGPAVITRPWEVILWAIPGSLIWFACTALLILVAIRCLGFRMKTGYFPVRSAMGFRIWASERIMDMARDLLFPLYASLLTPWWLRLLGAKVGRDVEASTVILVPAMTTIASGAFLADDTMVASYELGRGWMKIDRAKVGKRAFLGNSGITAAGRKVPKNSLVAVLSAAPKKSRKGSSWIGSPPVQLRRTEVEANSARTYNPPTAMKVARGCWETLRLTSVVVHGIVVSALMLAVLALAGTLGLSLTLLLSGVLTMLTGAVAAGLAIVAKWVFVGKIRVGTHPLWSSFIWRNEVADCFVEVIAAPWFTRNSAGTPALIWYLRLMGARIGKGVWCESYWLPEADLVELDDTSTINRGCVVQTHLFHDRVMAIDGVNVSAGATLGPNSVILPAAAIGTGATVGPASLVMRGEYVPDNAYFTGNPVVPWVDAPALPVASSPVGQEEPVSTGSVEK